jgi:hypothetical protein
MIAHSARSSAAILQPHRCCSSAYHQRLTWL